jgi:hypothetical protein
VKLLSSLEGINTTGGDQVARRRPCVAHKTEVEDRGAARPGTVNVPSSIQQAPSPV